MSSRALRLGLYLSALIPVTRSNILWIRTEMSHLENRELVVYAQYLALLIPIGTYANRAITLRPAAPKRIAASC